MRWHPFLNTVRLTFPSPLPIPIPALRLLLLLLLLRRRVHDESKDPGGLSGRGGAPPPICISKINTSNNNSNNESLKFNQ